jgi:hypothetical protein
LKVSTYGAGARLKIRCGAIGPLEAPFIPSQLDLSPAHLRKINNTFLLSQLQFIVANVTLKSISFGYGEQAGDEALVVNLKHFVANALPEQKEELFLRFLRDVGLGSFLQHFVEEKRRFFCEMPHQRLPGTDVF